MKVLTANRLTDGEAVWFAKDGTWAETIGPSEVVGDKEGGVFVDRDRILRLLVVLTSTPTLRLLHDHLGASTEQVAEDVEWFVGAAIGAASRSTGP